MRSKHRATRRTRLSSLRPLCPPLLATAPGHGPAPPMCSHIAIGLFLVLLSVCCHSACAIDCYQCDSNSNLECSEEFDHNLNSLRPLPCDFIHEARFCIKTTGMFGGRISTIRSCSSRDQGDFCTYIDRPGDIRHTRSCIYTCSSHGCNGATSPTLARTQWLVALCVALATAHLRGALVA